MTTTESCCSPRRPARAEHVGSLIRPKQLREAVFDTMDIKPDDLSAASDGGLVTDELRELEDEMIRDAVAKQLEAGLDVVTDGEFRRLFFTASSDSAFSGFEPGSMEIPWYGSEGLAFHSPPRPVVTSRLKKIGNPLVEDARFLASITDAPSKVTLPATSLFLAYGSYTPGITDEAYRDFDEYAAHIASLQNDLITEAVTAGGSRYIQVDFPSYPLLVDEQQDSLWDVVGLTREQMLDAMLTADRLTVDGLPDDVFKAMHICRGNPGPGTWLVRGSLEPVAERMFGELPYDGYIIEWSSKDLHGDYSPLRHVPKDRIVTLGLVSTKVIDLESEDMLLREIEEATKYIDVSQLAISPQCGFGTAVAHLRDEDVQWRKLELVSRVADQVWPR